MNIDTIEIWKDTFTKKSHRQEFQKQIIHFNLNSPFVVTDHSNMQTGEERKKKNFLQNLLAQNNVHKNSAQKLNYMFIA